MTRKSKEFIHEGKYAAEVPIELIEDDTAWSPYLSPEDVHKLDTVRTRFAARRHRRSYQIWPRVRADASGSEVIKTADWIIDLGPEAWPELDPGASDGGGEKACPRA